MVFALFVGWAAVDVLMKESNIWACTSMAIDQAFNAAAYRQILQEVYLSGFRNIILEFHVSQEICFYNKFQKEVYQNAPKSR